MAPLDPNERKYSCIDVDLYLPLWDNIYRMKTIPEAAFRCLPAFKRRKHRQFRELHMPQMAEAIWITNSRPSRLFI